jgi:sulfoxide reductase heme-binding subunit YedZ
MPALDGAILEALRKGALGMGLRARANAVLRWLPTWPVYLAGIIPVPLLFVDAQAGRLGPEPIQAMEHALGTYALQFLIAGLCISPARQWLGVNMIKFRRALGLLAFFYVCLHLLVWLLLDIGAWDRIWADILKRPYVTIGMLGFVGLIPLAMTSNNWSVRKLGRTWRRLHLLTYAVVLLGGVHYLMIQKVYDLEALVYGALITAVLLIRAPRVTAWARRLRRSAP